MSKAEPNLTAEFFRDSVQDFISITMKGTTDTVLRKATPADVERFPDEWARYQSGRDEPEPEGIPLTDIPGLGKEQILMLKLHSIRTAEELAAVDDAVLVNLGMGMRALHRTAKLVVGKRRDNSELDTLRERLAALEAITNPPPLGEPVRRGPGRPPKTAHFSEQFTQEGT